MKWLKKALGRSGRKVAEEHVTRGYIAAHERRLDQAQQHYADAIDADDTLAVAFFNAGQTELERYNRDVGQLDPAARARRLDKAAEFLLRGLALESAHAPSWRTLARVRERQGRVADAVVAWEAVVAHLQPGNADGGIDDVGLERVLAQKEIGRLQPEADLQAAVIAARNALAAAAPGPAEEAVLEGLLATWERVRLLGVVEPLRLHGLAGSLARKLGDARSRALLEEAVEKDKHDIEAWKDLATLCLTLGDLPSALTASMAAYREDPVDAGLVCNVGVCHLAAGDLDKAAEFIDLASSMSADDPIVRRAVLALKQART